MASAEFLKTIYEYQSPEPEQNAPVIMMYSDPAFPDRTEAFLQGKEEVILERLINALNQLCHMGATKIVICCMTIHHLLPRLPADLQSKIVSPLDVIFSLLPQKQGTHLLICSRGARVLNLFQRHPQWESLQRHFVLPDEHDQGVIHHKLISPIKSNQSARTLLPLLQTLLAKYDVRSFIVGCSEIHILAKQLAALGADNRFDWIDPFAVLARSFWPRQAMPEQTDLLSIA